jgi:hypothetical protein
VASPSFNQTPDTPQAFGYKVMWFALKTSDPKSVIDALEFGEATPANWASGLAAVYSDSVLQTHEPWVFVSPPIDGWVLAVGAWFPYPVTIDEHRDIGQKFDVLFSRLMRRFDDVQFFGSHRGVDFVTWARAVQGKPTRIFGFADGDALANVGEQTSAEAQLKFANLSGLSPPEASDRIFAIAGQQQAEEHRLVLSGISSREARAKARQNGGTAFLDETDVLDLAALWSLNPLTLNEHGLPPSAGLAVRLPNDLMQ